MIGGRAQGLQFRCLYPRSKRWARSLFGLVLQCISLGYRYGIRWVYDEDLRP